MFGLGIPELVLLLFLGLLLFGGQLPKMARSLGQGLVEFRRGVSGLEDEVRR
jgi:sec-independent protein translocase protein TatA